MKSVIADLAEGRTTSAALTASLLARTAAHDDKIGAFLHLNADAALAAAEASDRRRAKCQTLGSLDGVVLGIKDNILTQGVPTTAASKILSGYLPPYSATVVRRLQSAGAVLLGKLNCDEFAMGSSTENSAFQVTKNPWDRACAPGGSSGGSAAAVAAGFVCGALGTDTGGSVRQPAALCGVVGMKPSYGRLSRYGVIAFASSLDQVGVMASDVTGCASLLEAMGGHDPRDSTSTTKGPITVAKAKTTFRIGVPKVTGVSDEVMAAYENAKAMLRRAGCTFTDIELPPGDAAIAAYYLLCTAEAASNLARYDGVRYGVRAEGASSVEELYSKTRGQGFGDEVKRRILLGNYVLSQGYYDAYYKNAQRARRMFAVQYERAFTKCDVIMTPTSPTTAFALGERTEDPVQMYLSDVFTIGANLAGLPAISLPAPVSAMPVGMQFTAPYNDDEGLLAAALFAESIWGQGKLPTLGEE